MAEVYDPRTTPWQIDEADYYEIEDPREQKEFLIRYSVLAPSGHNTQPWMFRIVDEGIEIRPDYTRRLPVCDPDDRELLISVGAAVTNLRVAAAHFGFESSVLYDEEPVAMVALRETCDPDVHLRSLFDAIVKRHTARGDLDSTEIEPETLSRICELVESCEHMRFIVPHDRPRAAELIEEGDRLLLGNEDWRAELAAWVRPNDSSLGDGISGDAFGIPGPLAAMAPWIVARFDLGETRGKRDRELAEHAAGLVVLTGDDDPVALIRTGETLQRFLLTLTSLGVQYAFANQPVEVPELRKQVWKLIRTPKPPQLLLRIGHGRGVWRPMPRRRLDSVMV